MDEVSNRKGMGTVGSSKPKDDKKPSTPVTTLEIDCKSIDGKREFKGKFPFKVPTLGDRIDMAILKAQYLQEIPDVAVGAEGLSNAEMLSYLHVTIGKDAKKEDLPSWWTSSRRGIDLYDWVPIAELYASARAYEAGFLAGDSDSGADETEDRGRSEPADSGAVVDDVPPTSDRPEVIATLGKGGVGAGAPGEGS